MPTPYTHDNWAWLNHRIGDIGGRIPNPVGGMVNSWVPDEDQRRLAAYTVCAAILDNVNRYHLQEKAGADLPPDWRLSYREYGDPQLLTVSARAAVLGDAQTATVDIPETDDQADSQSAARRAYAEICQAWLDRWVDDEQLEKKMLEVEQDSLGLGDGVYALGWNPMLGRPALRVYDPGWYYPDLTTMGDDDDFPRTVHVAWEEQGPRGKVLLRRKTWRLVYLEQARRLPWHGPDESSNVTCLYSDGEWDLSDVATGDGGLYDLADDRATWYVQDLDLGFDFLPVIHVPNGAAAKEHFGRPIWWQTIQLLEDIAGSDSDLQASSQLIGSTAMVSKGAGLPDELPGGPGAHYRLPEGGSAELLDNSRSLVAMTNYRKDQRDLLSTNTRMPAEVLGRVKASELPSGFAAVVMWSPFKALIRECRLVRRDKYRLLPKMAMRIAQVNQALPAGELPRAEVVFGAFMPADQQAAIDTVVKLWAPANGRPLISLETAVRILQEDGGLDFDDATAMVRQVNREGYDHAVKLLDASGDETAVRELLNTGELPELVDQGAVLAGQQVGQPGNTLPTPDVTGTGGTA